MGYNLYSLREAEEQAIHAEALRTAQLVALEMRQIVIGAENLTRAIAAAPVVERGDGPGCSAYVARVVALLPQFIGIAVIDRQGVISCMPDMPEEEMFVGDRGYFLDAVRSGQAVVGVYSESRRSNRPFLPVAAPLTDGGAWSGGAVVAALDLEWLGVHLKDRVFVQGSAVTIADRDGRIVAREPFSEDFVGTVIPDDFQRLVRATEAGTAEVTSQDGARRVIGYVPAAIPPEGLYVSAGFSTETTFAPLDQATLRSVLIALGSICVSLALAASTSAAFIRRPFERIVGTITAWRRGDEGARTGMSPRDGELGAVGEAIDGYMDELASARVERRKSEAQRELLLGELDHRVRNLLATVQAVARQSFRFADEPEVVNVFLERLRTMSGAHSLLMRDEWQQAMVRTVVDSAIAPFASPEETQFRLEGPSVALNSRAVLGLSMALHELATNAVKYGALSVEEGRIDIYWEIAPGAEGAKTFRLTWRERNGPAVAEPAAKGFGSRLIEEALANQIGGKTTMTYPITGAVFTLTAPVSEIAPAPDPASAPMPNVRTQAPPLQREAS